MKRAWLLLISVAVLSWPRPAAALPGGTVFFVDITNGADPADSITGATFAFELDADTGAGCRYYGVWDDATSAPFEAECYLTEEKTFGHASCVSNGGRSFDTMLTIDAPFPCSSFDRFGRAHRLFLLVGMERAAPVSVRGLIQWTAATPMLSAFEATPYL